MVKIFGKNATPWEDIWMPVDPTYVATRHATWKARPKQNALLHYYRKMCTSATRLNS
jgi:hypothetical protein